MLASSLFLLLKGCKKAQTQRQEIAKNPRLVVERFIFIFHLQECFLQTRPKYYYSMCLKSPRMSHFNLLRQKILLFHTLEIFRKISTPERYILPKLEVWYVLIILSTDLIDMHIMNLTRRYRIKTRSLAASCLMSAEHHLFHYHMQIEFKEFPVKYNQSSRIILH